MEDSQLRNNTLLFRFEDATSHFEPPSDHSTGFMSRRKLFLDEDGSEFTSDWVQLSGRLFFDLESMASGILPGIQVLITLDYSSDDFRLLSAERDRDYPANKNICIEIGSVSYHETYFIFN